MKPLPVFLLLFLSFFLINANAQPVELSIDKWVKKLTDPDDKKNAWYDELYNALIPFDSSQTFHFLNELASHPSAKGNYFLARFNCLKSEMIYEKSADPSKTWLFKNEQEKKEILRSLADAMQKSYECNDDYLAAYVSGVYGRYLSFFDDTEPAVMYLMNSADLYEKMNLSAKYSIYVVVGEMLWRVREYEKSIKYTRRALEVLDTAHIPLLSDYKLMCHNTIALSYHRMGQYDSALFHYNIGLELAKKIKTSPWQGFISGNIAQIDYAQEKYSTALPLFLFDYETSNSRGFYDDAANSLQWAARTNLALGNKDTALRQVRTAFMLLKKWPAPNYLQNAYFTATEIFRALKNNDSVLYYSALYNKLHDSLERVIFESSINIAQLRLNDEKSRYSIMNFQREKQAQAQQRNLIIGAVIFLSAILLLLINRQRLKSKYRQELADQEKLRMQQEMDSAKDQLDEFTRNIIEKTNLIEKLEQQVSSRTNSQEEQKIISELSSQTILTEQDWIRFKTLFEKIHPGFFAKLKARASDITVAEQRMAAITRLGLSGSQMAAMLGISVDSVRKNRLRLKQRLELSPDTSLEEIISAI